MTLNITKLQKERSLLPVIIAGSIVAGLGYIGYWMTTTDPESIDVFNTAHTQSQEILQPLVKEIFHHGAGENELRQKVNTTLSYLMNPTVSSSSKIQLSKQGITVLDTIMNSIDTTNNSYLRFRDSISELSLITEKIRLPEDHVYANKKIAEYNVIFSEIDTILETLTAMNMDAHDICTQIATDKGVLTDEHVRYLNKNTPEAEERFNTLTNSYEKLSKLVQ